MKTSYVLFAILLAAMSIANVVTVLADDQAAPNRLKLLTWNVQLLPEVSSIDKLNKGQSLRTPWIIEFLNKQDYDIVVLQEVLDRKLAEEIKAGLKASYPYVVARDAERGNSPCLGGILFASRIPLKYVDHVVYKNVSGVNALAEKGCILVEGERGGMKFQLAGTHLQAGDKETRRKEYPEIFENVLKPHAADGVPQILVGDMNTHVADDDFRLLLSTTQMQAFPIDDPHPFTTDRENSWNKGKGQGRGPRHIDHVLLNPHGTHTRIIRQTIERPRREHEGQTIDLANHYGLVAEVELVK